MEKREPEMKCTPKVGQLLGFTSKRLPFLIWNNKNKFSYPC